MALYIDTAAAAADSPAPEDSGIRDLVEGCAHADDITPLVRLLFEAQTVPESPTAVDADGQRMVSIIAACLKSVASDQDRAISEVARAGAGAIAGAVSEFERLGAGVQQVRATLVGGNDTVQASGGALAARVSRLSQASEVLENLARARAALAASTAVLERCLEAGRLISGGRLYHALCALDEIRRVHLGSLQLLLSLPPASASAPAARPDAPPSGRRGRSQGGGGGAAARAGQLHSFFAALVDDLTASARQLAVSDFNDWLVTVRGAARAIGLAAIADAAGERSLEAGLTAERRAALALLSDARAAAAAAADADAGAAAGTGPASAAGAAAAAAGGQRPGAAAAATCAAAGAALAGGDFRQRLLREAAAVEEGPAAGAGAGAGPGESSGGGGFGGSGGGGEGDGGAGLFESLRAATAGGAPAVKSRAAPARPARTPEQEAEARATPLPPEELEAVRPGAPEEAISELLRRHGVFAAAAAAASAASASASARGSGGGAGARGGSAGGRGAGGKAAAGPGGKPGAAAAAPAPPPAGGEGAAAAAAAAAAAGGAGAGLLSLDLGGLRRAVHIHRSLGRLATDLAPPAHFSESYEPYLASLAGFFVIESYLERAGDGFIPEGQRAALWDSALRSVKAALEGALDRMPSPRDMLAVKDFVLLACSALEHAGYQVAPILEVLTAACGRYHELLAARLAEDLGQLAAGDGLGNNTEVRSAEQHEQLSGDLGLPATFDSAAPRPPPPEAPPCPPLPYVSPYTPCAPAALLRLRAFAADSAEFLRGVYQPWELLPALLSARDRAAARALPEALAARLAAARGRGRECMRLAANAWAMREALGALDDWVARLAAAAPGEDLDRAQPPRTAPGAASEAARARARQLKAVAGGATGGGGGGEGRGLAAALRAAQDAAEAAALGALTGRIDELLDAGRRAPPAEWTPAAALPAGNSHWVAALLSSMQETFEAAQVLLPRASIPHLMRGALRAAAAAALRLLGPEGVPGFTLHAVARLAADLEAVERFAARWPAQGLAAELAAPVQLCALLLSNRFEEALDPPLRSIRYGALDSQTIAAALDRYREVRDQPKRHPDWPSRKAAEAVARQLRAGAGVRGGGGGGGGGGGAAE
ncbi:hypothetical protein Rsub_08126 [Raphidocelis subcapitata]|uniref:Uncharacterized protein n=1 Tax=Raphidocelis subcapitata TaxID=307507 RepID=A0A2V0PAE9_9CHLO|nr:hypothetical protein Rsub_08126 [Raphidocelis subcapitata]|eukprot:GBF94883.1 hypothetical protein Rsub_08126 [Raphidocelis subcapitata]